MERDAVRHESPPAMLTLLHHCGFESCFRDLILLRERELVLTRGRRALLR